jgi:glycosyltransferase involved in cell wall biosynthesis
VIPTAAPPVVCFPFVGNLVGGAHISALKLILNLDRARFEPLVLLHQPHGPLADVLAEHGIAVEPTPTPHYLEGGGWARDALALCRRSGALAGFLRRRRVRIVHTNDGRMHATWSIPARLAGARFLWHHRGNPRARGVRLLGPLLVDQVLCVSRFATPKGSWFDRSGRCAVVHSPFDTRRAAPDRAACRQALLQEFGRPAGTRVVGFFGNLVARKRPQLFIEVVAALRERAPELELLAPIFGPDRGLLESLRARAEALGVSDRVTFMGFRYPPERWLAACDALLVPAVEEPFGRTLIEAMLLGTLVIAADSGGNPEAIRHGDTGWLVPADDAAALAAQTLAALRDPAGCAVITARARADALARFGLERHADAVMSVYDRLLGVDCPVAELAMQTK